MSKFPGVCLLWEWTIPAKDSFLMSFPIIFCHFGVMRGTGRGFEVPLSEKFSDTPIMTVASPEGFADALFHARA